MYAIRSYYGGDVKDNRGRGGGKTSNKGKSRSKNRGAPYQTKNPPRANTAGKALNINHKNDSESIVFIADSGATEHIIGKSFMLSNFQKCTKGVIKSANKNQNADIKIDGRGDLFLKSQSGKTIALKNVLSAGDIANNLISLRKFVELGLSVYLDDRKIMIYDKNSGDEYISGV